MRLGSFLSFVIDVSEKFDKCNDGSASALYYETLHMSLSVMLKEMTEDQYRSIPLVHRKIYEKLERSIFQYVSKEYQQEYVQYLLENGKYLIASNEAIKQEPKMVTKCKHTIGFTADLDKEL